MYIETQAMALYKPPPYIMKKNEDLPAISSTDPTSGGRLMARARRCLRLTSPRARWNGPG